MPPTFASQLTMSAIGLVSKAFTRFATKGYDVRGLPILLDALKEPGQASSSAEPSRKGKERAVGLNEYPEVDGTPIRRGIVTVCNHNSVVDDPFTWSIMPLSTYFPFATPTHTSRNTRWTLGASDIMFTKPLHSKFFTLGQVIETHRGGGVFQPAVDEAVRLLQKGEWIHIFPEGRVNQHKYNPDGGLFPFKWGVGRIVMDSKIMPEIIPMWISGFDQIMNEYRGQPRVIPRPGARISITVGQPITERIKPLVDEWRKIVASETGALGVGGEWGSPAGGSALPGSHRSTEVKSSSSVTGTATAAGPFQQRLTRSVGELADGRERSVRIKITDAIQEAVRQIGEQVEREEGRMDKREWSQSTAGVNSPSA